LNRARDTLITLELALARMTEDSRYDSIWIAQVKMNFPEASLGSHKYRSRWSGLSWMSPKPVSSCY
jgi:hypothetical protein